MRFLKTWRIPFACALSLTSLPLALIVMSRTTAASAGPQSPTAAQPVEVAPASSAVEISLSDALGRRWVDAHYIGNGHSEIKAVVANRSNKSLRLTFPSGLIFETPDLHQQMVVARPQTLDLPPTASRATWLASAATRSGNAPTSQPYRLCPGTLPQLNALFVQADQSPELSRECIQTAVLLVTENAPLSLFAKFALLSGDAPTRPALPSYQVNTGEILAAFTLLKNAGYPRMNLLAAREPQLKIEAMIDPLSHAAAVHYYNLAPAQEWAYWRDELSKGDVSTRHYALYGIGRYYPEVALQMLPDWARASQLSPLMRASAIQAMAETHRPEAISVLQQLVGEFGVASELGESARRAIAYLENQRATPVSRSAIEFKISQASLR